MDLVATGVSKRFGSTRALEGVSLRLAAGRVHALVGENGAGKSTLLKILAGVLPADAGTMALDGRPYAPRGLREAEALGVALVFQEVTVNPALSVAENVFIGHLRKFRGRLGLLDRRRMEGEAQAVLDRIGADVSVRDEIHRLDPAGGSAWRSRAPCRRRRASCCSTRRPRS